MIGEDFLISASGCNDENLSSQRRTSSPTHSILSTESQAESHEVKGKTSSYTAVLQTRKCRFHRNQQYSIVALTGPTGLITERYAYSVYGQLTITDGSGVVRTSSAEGNRYTYTGREWDEVLGLYHYRARMFDPLSGRFTGKDPIVFVSADIENYLYCHSNPLAYVDSSGLQAVAVGAGKQPKTGQKCELKFTWQFPVLGVPNLGLGQKMLDKE